MTVCGSGLLCATEKPLVEISMDTRRPASTGIKPEFVFLKHSNIFYTYVFQPLQHGANANAELL